MSVLVIDFGSQVTQLIARRVREAGVYCEIVPYNKAEEALAARTPRAIILSGGPASVTENDTPRVPQTVFELGVPVLGICYGEMALCGQLGGEVEAGHNREFGRADIHIVKASPLLEGLGEGGSEPVWMSHGDKITAIPPGFDVIATSEGSPYAVIADETRKFYGVQFHPEVMHTPRGAVLLRNFVRNIAGIPADWNMHAFRAREIEKIRAQVGKGRVICGLSGGVDSSVAAVLIHEAIGDLLTCIFVDTGLMRAGEEGMFEGVVIRRHAVGGGHGAQGADEIIGARIAHHADRAYRQQNGKGLPDLVIQTGLADFIEINGVRLAQYVQLLARDFARNANGKARPRKGVAPHKRLGQAQFAAQRAHLVLEEFAQRLDQLQFHPLRQPTDIVMRLDGDGRTAGS
jgi:GMP synthase (glutamine-hydrolysing)